MAGAPGGKLLRRDMLPEPVDVPVEGGLSLEEATAVAQAKARERHPEVMLLAWFSRGSGDFSPRITC